MTEPVKLSAKAIAKGTTKAIGGHFADELPPPPPPLAPPPAAAEDEPTDPEAIKAKKRAEIEARLADLKLRQAKEAEQKANFFGEHPGITCDGCGIAVVGYRYKCKDCPNHDVCESCYDEWTKGKMTNGLGKQAISNKPSDHRLVLHKDKNFSPLVKKADAPAGLTAKKADKTKPNDPCPCGSGKKYKKCCAVKAVAPVEVQ